MNGINGDGLICKIKSGLRRSKSPAKVTVMSCSDLSNMHWRVEIT